jgi:4-hydroxy-tetrahydrodipicolinate reductase
VHVVVGSSGLSAGNYAELDRLARDWGVGVVAAVNFSIMAAILKRAAAQVRMPQSALAMSQLGGPVEARGAGVGRYADPLGAAAQLRVITEIVFGGAGERLIMRHYPGESPDPYVAGTLLAIRKVAEVPGVRRGLDSLLLDRATGP